MPEQRNPYRAGRPWLRLGFMAPDGSARHLELVADTGSPAAVILRDDLFAQLVHDWVPARDRTGTFGTHRAGWVRLYNPELDLVEFVLGYGNDETARTVGRSSIHFAGLVGLPVLRLGEYGGDADAFWFRPPPAPPTPGRPMTAPSPDTLKQTKSLDRPAAVFAVAAVPGSQRVYLGSQDFKVYSADLAADKVEPKELYAHQSYVTGVAVAGRHLVSGGYDGKLVWWDTAAGKVVRTVDAHAKWVRKVVASPDGTLVASVADDMAGKLWDADSGKLVRELRGHREKTPHHFPSMLYAAAFSADGRLLATADKVGHVVVWEVATGREVAAVEAPVMYTWDPVQRLHSIGGVRSVAFSPDGKLLAVGGMGKVGNIDHLEGKARVEVFDWRAGKQVYEVQSDKFGGLVNRLQFAPGGEWLLGAGGAGEGFVLFLDVGGKKVLRQEKLPMHVHDFALAADARSLVCAGHNRVTAHTLG